MTDVELVEVVRNDFVECVHRARAVVTAPDGSVELALGDVAATILPRSSSKPLQAVAMLRHGLDLDGELLALVAASHSGEAFHREGVERILAGCGLGPAALQNTPDLPFDVLARQEWLRAGHGPQRVAMNCSGKHAGMVRTCVANGWSLPDYLDPGHPLQQAVVETLAELTGEQPGPTAIDGCGAPLLGLSLAGLARSFGRLAAARGGPEQQLADAVRAHPEWTSGTRRDEVIFHREVPGSVNKLGAEGVHALGLADGRGIALKVVDGADRPRGPLLAELLIHLGHDTPGLQRLRTSPVLGHGEPVGEVRVVAGALAG